jgi:hypothetical protein
MCESHKTCRNEAAALSLDWQWALAAQAARLVGRGIVWLLGNLVRNLQDFGGDIIAMAAHWTPEKE